MTERNRLTARKVNIQPPHPHAPSPDMIDHERFWECLKTPHDVGGEPDAPYHWEEKEEEQWELNTFATCECLAWRGVFTAEERRRRQNVDWGNSFYLAFPYYGRWLLTAALIMVDKQFVTLTELMDKMEEVRDRHKGGKKQS